MNDQFGNEIKVGDKVAVTCVDASAGAHLHLTQMRHTVVGLGRTRAKLEAGAYTGQVTVGAAALRIVEPVDGRRLRNAAEAWADERRKIEQA